MRSACAAFISALAMGFALVQPADAQNEDTTLIEVGAPAPDFALPGATRYGVLEDPVRLSDLRGEAVVLAFFFRARTRG